MLGQFLEVSVAARPLSAAFEFYRALGFQALPVGDALREPYVALFDGHVAIGLHEHDYTTAAPVLTFVRPRLREYVRAIRKLGIELEESRLADDEFNRIAFSDPNGQPLELLEARTFPPGEWNARNVSACGEFLEYSLATDSIERSRAFWEAVGLAVVAAADSPHAWLRLAGRGLVLGLHEASFRAGLSFRSPELAARVEYLEAKGLRVTPGGPLAQQPQRAATLRAPDGLAIYLVEDAP
jgi:catechol 2,3-dioxygenase-like lactoylglutathione lyase family enzyme